MTCVGNMLSGSDMKVMLVYRLPWLYCTGNKVILNRRQSHEVKPYTVYAMSQCLVLLCDHTPVLCAPRGSGHVRI